jgi:hypothetical protein
VGLHMPVLAELSLKAFLPNASAKAANWLHPYVLLKEVKGESPGGDPLAPKRNQF